VGAGEWETGVRITGQIHLPPAPRFMDAVGHNYDFEIAVADLIDNSIDAGARTVLARFLRRGAAVRGFAVIDDGHGIPEEKIDAAMTLGGDQDYDQASLGFFGVGLKASSFSQAGRLTVLSRDDRSGMAAGRRWVLEKARTSFECDVVDPADADDLLTRRWGATDLRVGTIVVWDQMSVFPTRADPAVVDPFIDQTISRLVSHLGLVFHRLLAAGRITINVATAGPSGRELGVISPVVPIDPFAYARSGSPRYPKQLVTTYHRSPLTAECHIWPGRSNSVGFKLDGTGRSENCQGFYFYRNDRLLQVGGWNHMFNADREHQLARVAIDISGSWEEYLRMNPEKSGVRGDSEFHRAIARAKSEDGTTFADYMEDAREAYKASRKPKRDRPKAVPPGKGFPHVVKKTLGEELDYLPDEDPFAVRWKTLRMGIFLDVDRGTRTLWVNQKYRAAVLGSSQPSLNDAPLLKSLLYLLTQDVFKGQRLGPRDKDSIRLWQQVLTDAARAELDLRGKGES
jgi:hypothetical protein